MARGVLDCFQQLRYLLLGSEATRFSADNILPVCKYILETAYKNYDGYKVVKTVVPAGKKP